MKMSAPLSWLHAGYLAWGLHGTAATHPALFGLHAMLLRSNAPCGREGSTADAFRAVLC